MYADKFPLWLFGYIPFELAAKKTKRPIGRLFFGGANASKCKHICVYGWVWGNCITVNPTGMVGFSVSYKSVSVRKRHDSPT